MSFRSDVEASFKGRYSRGRGNRLKKDQLRLLKLLPIRLNAIFENSHFGFFAHLGVITSATE